MKTTVAVHGAAGVMGRHVLRQVLGADDLQLVAAIDRASAPDLGRDAGALAGLPECGVPVTPDFADTQPEVTIDFSSAAALPGLVDAAVQHKTALVVCTTGYGDGVGQRLREAGHDIAVLASPNMALGVNLLFALVEQVARAIGSDCDIEIVEMHHRRKADAPSGTAKRIAKAVADGLDQALDDIAIYGREGRYEDGRPSGELAIHTLRGGDVVGDHSAIFASTGERIELTHRATSREVFAAGAVRAARWIAGKPAGWYRMAQVLGLEEA